MADMEEEKKPRMTDCLEIGPTPSEEECVQLGDDDYVRRAEAECDRFIALIRKSVGPEPLGARLYIKRNLHDFGLYFEVAVKFDPAIPKAVEYAFRCEREAPSRWGS